MSGEKKVIGPYKSNKQLVIDCHIRKWWAETDLGFQARGVGV